MIDRTLNSNGLELKNSTPNEREWLDLSDSSLTDSQIPALLEFLKLHKQITYLDVSHNDIGDLGAMALAQLNTLTTLDISYNKIGVIGAEEFAKNITLMRLSMAYNTIGDEGAIVLAEKNKFLTVLDVKHNDIGFLGVKALAENKTLKILNLTYNNIGDEGAELLARNEILNALDVSGCNIGYLGFQAFAHNQSITKLFFSDNNVNYKNLEQLINVQDLNKMTTLLVKSLRFVNVFNFSRDRCYVDEELRDDCLKHIEKYLEQSERKLGCCTARSSTTSSLFLNFEDANTKDITLDDVLKNSSIQDGNQEDEFLLQLQIPLTDRVRKRYCLELNERVSEFYPTTTVSIDKNTGGYIIKGITKKELTQLIHPICPTLTCAIL